MKRERWKEQKERWMCVMLCFIDSRVKKIETRPPVARVLLCFINPRVSARG